MNFKFSSLLFQAISALLLLHAVAAAEEAQTQMLLRCEIFHLSLPTAEELRKAHPKDDDLYAALQRSVQAGAAGADKMMLIRTLPGATVKLQQIDTYPYLDHLDPDGKDFLSASLGQELEIAPEVNTPDGSKVMAVRVTSIKLGPTKDGHPTFVKSQTYTPLPTSAGHACLLGDANAEFDPDRAALVFITPTMENPPVDQGAITIPESMRAQFEVISLPQATALPLLAASPDSRTLHRELHTLINARTAKLETLQMIPTKLKEKSMGKQVAEFPFPSSFERSYAPQQITITDPSLRALLLQPSEDKHPLPAPNAGTSLTILPAASTFEVLDLGDSLQLETTDHGDGQVSVKVHAAKQRLLSMFHGGGKDQPRFGKQTLQTQVLMSLNTPLLLGTINRPQQTDAPGSIPEDNLWMAFLTLHN